MLEKYPANPRQLSVRFVDLYPNPINFAWEPEGVPIVEVIYCMLVEDAGAEH